MILLVSRGFASVFNPVKEQNSKAIKIMDGCQVGFCNIILLFVICYLLFVVCCLLFVVCYLFFVVGFWSQ